MYTLSMSNTIRNCSDSILVIVSLLFMTSISVSIYDAILYASSSKAKSSTIDKVYIKYKFAGKVGYLVYQFNQYRQRNSF